MNLSTHQMTFRIIYILAFMLLAVSCKKEEEQPAEAARIFKPGEVKVATGATSAKITWTKPILSADKPMKYTIDFSLDSLFTAITYTGTTDTTGFTVTEENLTVRTRYFARIKANATADQPESKYVVSASFQLTGIQLFLPIRDSEIKEDNVVLRYTPTTGLNSIVLKPVTGAAITVTLSAADAAAGLKAITGLTGGVKYTAEIFEGTKSKGTTTFTTQTPTTYTVKIAPGDDLAAAISTAANGAVIGLQPGTYELTSLATFITQKTITLKSTSGNPADTKVNFKEFDLEGTGAGITLSGIEFDGTAGAALYFLNFIGSQSATSSAATFTNVTVDNCIVHGIATAFLRGDRGAAARDFKITGITVNNSVVYDAGSNGSSSYYTFHLNKLQFNALTISKSTFYNSGPGLVTANVTYAGEVIPEVNISYSTFNGFGGNAKYALLDANANPIKFVFQNSILANTPKSGTVVAAALRATGVGSVLTFTFNNYFNLSTALSNGTDLTFSTATVGNNQTVNLGWTAETASFTLPASSSLRTASATGGALGDPRWTFTN